VFVAIAAWHGGGMCRNIRPLFNFEPPAYPDEVHEAALQYVRKVSGMNKPSLANQRAFDEAVDAIEDATARRIKALTTSAPPKDREVERARARARSEARFGTPAGPAPAPPADAAAGLPA